MISDRTLTFFVSRNMCQHVKPEVPVLGAEVIIKQQTSNSSLLFLAIDRATDRSLLTKFTIYSLSGPFLQTCKKVKGVINVQVGFRDIWL